VSCAESDDRELVLVVFLEELAQNPPGLCVARVLLDLSLQAEYRLLYLLPLNELLGSAEQVLIVFLELVLLLELDSPWASHQPLVKLGILLPDLVPLRHHVPHSTCSSLLLPHLHHLVKLGRGQLLFVLDVHVILKLSPVLDLIEIIVVSHPGDIGLLLEPELFVLCLSHCFLGEPVDFAGFKILELD
jgi:hypothetical protein